MSKWYSVYVTVRKCVAVEIEDDQGEDEAIDAALFHESGDCEAEIADVLDGKPSKKYTYDEIIEL